MTQTSTKADREKAHESFWKKYASLIVAPVTHQESDSAKIHAYLYPDAYLDDDDEEDDWEDDYDD